MTGRPAAGRIISGWPEQPTGNKPFLYRYPTATREKLQSNARAGSASTWLRRGHHSLSCIIFIFPFCFGVWSTAIRSVLFIWTFYKQFIPPCCYSFSQPVHDLSICNQQLGLFVDKAREHRHPRTLIHSVLSSLCLCSRVQRVRNPPVSRIQLTFHPSDSSRMVYKDQFAQCQLSLSKGFNNFTGKVKELRMLLRHRAMRCSRCRPRLGSACSIRDGSIPFLSSWPLFKRPLSVLKVL